MTARLELTGKTFSRLEVIEFAGLVPHGVNRSPATSWKCRCSCGTVKIIKGAELTNGGTKSCGCLKREQLGNASRTHGATTGRTHTPEYGTWQAMKRRCMNPNSHEYEYYGGRGIKVCERWHKFENFLEDMGKKPSKFHSLDRINNDGNYEPSNCRWATRVEQAHNTRCKRIEDFSDAQLLAELHRRQLLTVVG